MKLMVTGGLGFIGTNFVKMLLEETDHRIVIIDKRTYASNDYFIKNRHPRITVIEKDICEAAKWEFDINGIIHFAAESHVDNAIDSDNVFIHSNVMGTHQLLQYALKKNVKKFLYISTDEVYGCTPFDSDYEFKETDQLNPRNPYSATKAAGEHIAMAYYHTHGLPVVITRSCNNYGKFQHDEKLIPTMVRNVVRGTPLPVYGKGQNVREWIAVEDNCRAILEVFEHSQVGEILNIGSSYRVNNLALVKDIIKYLGRGEITFVQDRKGHDMRYALDTSKIETEFGFKVNPAENMYALENTINWYRGFYESKTNTSNK